MNAFKSSAALLDYSDDFERYVESTLDVFLSTFVLHYIVERLRPGVGGSSSCCMTGL